MGLNYLAYTGWSDKHYYVDEFVEGNSVHVTVFTYTLISIDNLTIAHVLYEFDKGDENVVLLVHNNNIYMGDDIIDSWASPIQCKVNDMRSDWRPKVQYLNNNNEQFITFPDWTSVPVD